MVDYCEKQANMDPQRASVYANLGDLAQRKLWHQLTVALFEFVSDTANTGSGDGFLALYSEFISQFENKFNQVMLARIIVAIGNTLLDPSETLRLYSSTLEKEARLGPAATLLLKCELGMARLKHGDSEGLKEAIEEGKSQLDEISGSTADTCVHSAFYKLASDFHKIAGPPEEYYHNALKYLTYTPLETMPRDQQFQMATDISLAAVTGDGVFNFGEVVATPAVSSLVGTSNAWLGELLHAFNKGDIDMFNNIAADHRDAMAAQPALVMRADFIKEKMALMALLNLVFERPSHERNIPFADIMARVKIPLDQVEWLIMRAMSLGLIRGLMDEVEQLVHVSWVQPRVLDNDQLRHLSLRLDDWKKRVDTALLHIEEQTPELFA